MGEANLGGSRPGTNHQTVIIRAIIGGVFLVVATLGAEFIKGCFDTKKSSSLPNAQAAPATNAKTTIAVSGSVKQKSGEAIPQARLSFFEDQSAAVVRYSDSDGHFAIGVPSTTQMLRVTVNAEGFESIENQLSLQGTGPEELYMHRLSVAAQPTQLRPPKSKIITSKGSAGLPTQQPNPSVPPACGPGVINCNLAPNQGDQSFHLYVEKRLPLASLSSQKPLLPNGLNPGTEVGIVVDRVFDDPMFDLACNVPCVITSEMLVYQIASDAYGEKGIKPVLDRMTEDGTQHRISFSDKLIPGASIVLQLRSSDKREVYVKSVNSSEQ